MMIILDKSVQNTCKDWLVLIFMIYAILNISFLICRAVHHVDGRVSLPAQTKQNN